MFVITTPRLRLRPFTVDDAPKLLVMSQEEGLRRWIPDQVYTDVDHAARVARALMAHTANAPVPGTHPYVLGVELDGELIGHVGLSPARGSVEIGYAIEDRHQGRGFATEAARGMTQWGLTELALPEVLGIAAPDNARSRRVLEKAGYVYDGDGLDRSNAPIVIYRASRFFT